MFRFSILVTFYKTRDIKLKVNTIKNKTPNTNIKKDKAATWGLDWAISSD